MYAGLGSSDEGDVEGVAWLGEMGEMLSVWGGNAML